MVFCVLVAPFVLKYVVTAEQHNKTAVECVEVPKRSGEVMQQSNAPALL